MISAVLFDMGGTLDGDGQHWLDRFENLYADAGLRLSHESVRAAFDDAERRAATDPGIAGAGLEEMVRRHLGWQFDVLGLDDGRLHHALVEAFVASVRTYAGPNAGLLAGLKSRGLTLGVVSNGCGNVEILCADLGYAPFLSLVVDSRCVGLFKPDPAIYVYAAARLGLPPSAIMMVGDSFERDIRPAKGIGMRTAWLSGGDRPCPDRAAVDLNLRLLSELPGALEAAERTVA
jgi:putative hydrolase of the HAD superfamily